MSLIANWATPLDTPPFIGIPLTAAITFTYGGVRTDLDARVVTPAGTPMITEAIALHVAIDYVEAVAGAGAMEGLYAICRSCCTMCRPGR